MRTPRTGTLRLRHELRLRTTRGEGASQLIGTNSSPSILLLFNLFFIHTSTIMKLTQLLPLAALSTAFVIPDEQVMSQVAIESHNTAKSVAAKVPCKDHATKKFEKTFAKLIDNSKNVFDQAVEYTLEAGEEASHKAHESAANAQAWLDTAAEKVEEFDVAETQGHHGRPKPNET